VANRAGSTKAMFFYRRDKGRFAYRFRGFALYAAQIARRDLYLKWFGILELDGIGKLSDTRVRQRLP